ncbi:MAG: hypothetical protein QG608_3381 [Actinomycetota bacterium]|nr:hypothetical protein [Actinomycetota bacterium]MDQ1295496.1 hypothetical protein [Actinomycetota bacterium]
MASDARGLPQTPEEVALLMDGLAFDDAPVAPGDLPPVPADDEDVLVPRSFKIPMRLDRALQELAGEGGKSELVRRYLAQGVTADLAARQQGGQVLIPLDEAVRLLTGLGRLPRSA